MTEQILHNKFTNDYYVILYEDNEYGTIYHIDVKTGESSVFISDDRFNLEFLISSMELKPVEEPIEAKLLLLLKSIRHGNTKSIQV